MLKQVESSNTTVSRQIHLQSCPDWTRSTSQTRAAAMWLLYFFKYRAHSRRALQKPDITQQNTYHSFHQSRQRRKRSFLKLQANASSLYQILSIFVISKKAIAITFALIHKIQATQTTQRRITSPTASYFMHLDTRVAARRNDSFYDACDFRNISYPLLVLISACNKTSKCCCS